MVSRGINNRSLCINKYSAVAVSFFQKKILFKQISQLKLRIFHGYNVCINLYMYNLILNIFLMNLD